MRLETGRHLSREQAEKILDATGNILQTIGIKVASGECRKKLKSCQGISLKGDRALISTRAYQGFMQKQKGRGAPPDKHGERLHGEPSPYTYQYRDAQNGKIKVYTTESLARCAGFVEKASHIYPVNPVIPGYPTDVPPEISSLARYRLAAENCSSGWPLAPDSLLAAEYLAEMAAVMGQEMNHLPVYMVSPLTLGGESLEIVLANKGRLKSFYTFAMPDLGVTTPMSVSMGLAMALAEVAGGCILVEALTGLEGEIRPNLFPFDFRYFNIAFGSPEKFLYEQASAELLAYITGGCPDYSSTNIHTWAKEADGRSAMEKGMMIMAGALSGAKRFYCVGALSLDEVFDPLQLIQDLECISFTQRILEGIPEDSVEECIMEEIREGLEAGFVCSDRSLDEYAGYVASPALFPRETLQKWQQNGGKRHRDYLVEQYRKTDSIDCPYILEAEKKKELRKIYDSALRRLGEGKASL